MVEDASMRLWGDIGQPVRAPAPPPEMHATIMHGVAVLQRRFVPVVSIFIITVLLFITIIQWLPRTYSAIVRLKVTSDEPVVGFSSEKSDRSASYELLNTVALSVKSEPVLLPMIDQLSLSKRWSGPR